MKRSIFISVILLPITLIMCIPVFGNTQNIKLKIDVVENEIGYMDPIILKGYLYNLARRKKYINEPKTSTIQIRKLGSKKWITILSLDPIEGQQRMDNPSGIYLNGKDTLSFYLATTPGKESINYLGIKTEWYYGDLGAYEIRMAYYPLITFGDKKVIYSNIGIFKVKEYEGMDVEAAKYLKELPFPTFFYEPLEHTTERMSIYLPTIKEICNDLLEKFPKSSFSQWIEFYLLEQSFSNVRTKESLWSFKEKLINISYNANPFLQVKAAFMLEFLNERWK